MRKGILMGAVIVFMYVLKTHSQVNDISGIKSSDSLQDFMVRKSEIKITDLVKLVKYAQGAVVFDSFYSYLKFMRPLERKMFLSQIVELTGHFLIDDSAADLAIKKSGLSDTCTACLMLKQGVNETQLQKIAELPDSELEASFRLLLTLFSIGYQEGYQKYKNTATQFWYWDFSDVENVFKLVELDYKQHVKVDEVLRP